MFIFVERSQRDKEHVQLNNNLLCIFRTSCILINVEKCLFAVGYLWLGSGKRIDIILYFTCVYKCRTKDELIKSKRRHRGGHG